VAYAALFVALGGTAYAAATINGADLKNRSVAGIKLKQNGAGPKEVNEGALGKVPNAKHADQAGVASSAANAGKLQGLDSTSFLRASRVISTGGMIRMPEPTHDVPLLTVGPYSFFGECGTTGGPNFAQVLVKSTINATADGGVNASGQGGKGPTSVTGGATNPVYFLSTTGTAGGIAFSVSETPTATSKGAVVYGLATLEAKLTPDQCGVSLLLFVP
jgi:hypothetical protein